MAPQPTVQMAVHAKTTSRGFLIDYVTAPRAKYTVVGELIRHVIPEEMQCSMGCGGLACKYDNPTHWSDDKQAIKGLYSSWVTDSLLAMSRPSTEIIEKYNIIDQFKRNGIKTVFNLQRPGEHASCGKALEPSSGFSYRPEVFMENDIYFYNFVWADYGVANLTTVLDMVKVMAFAMQEGKIAVHCHAGLGRTGVLLACFMAYTTRMSANQAISHVRAKRPNSIQTRGQLQCVRQFAQFLAPLRRVFSCAEPRSDPVTLSQYLTRQGHVLHGYERRELRHLPKIVPLICRLLIDVAENRQVIEEDVLEAPDVQDIEMTMSMVEKLGPDFGQRNMAADMRPRLPGPPTLPRHFNEPPIFYHHKSLSYSDSNLERLGSDLNLLAAQPHLGSLSQSNVNMPFSASSQNQSVASCCSTGSLWEKVKVTAPNDSPLLKKVLHKQSSVLGISQSSAKRANVVASSSSGLKAEEQRNGNNRQRCPSEVEESEVPFITLQSELSAEARRLLVAQALAVDLFLDGEEQHRHAVLTWQTELNLGGGWERLCSERDPFVLTGLMWSWLEQLKEPVISAQAATSLDPDNTEAHTVLNTLEQAPKQTLICLLDCMAHMLEIPAEVENAFLDRTIKAFTKLEKNSENGRTVYKTMTEVLKYILLDMRWTTEMADDELAALPPFK